MTAAASASGNPLRNGRATCPVPALLHRRLSAELARKETEQQDKEQHARALQRLVAELQAEMKRLAAQAALGPPTVLDLGKGERVYPPAPPGSGDTQQQQQQQGGQEGAAAVAAAQVAQAQSAVETACTAARVALADKGFTTRGLAARLASAPPLPLDALTATQCSLRVSFLYAVACN